MRFWLLSAAAMLLLAYSSLLAGPVLISDLYSTAELQPTKFVVAVDGISRDVLPERYQDGTSRLKYDLGDITEGPHTVKVKAVNSAVNPKSPLQSAEVVYSFVKTGSRVVPVKDDSEKRPATRTFKGYMKQD